MLSCEHAGSDVPDAYRHLFSGNRSILRTHRGCDIGIEPVALKAAGIFGIPLLACRTSRLLIEPNRSLNHRDLFSEFTRNLPAEDKTCLIQNIWKPHRDAVTKSVSNAIRRRRRVLHLALHSFAPVLEGQTRSTDIGLLYDPKREPEKHFAIVLQQILKSMTALRVRRNYPYRGDADGLTTALRRVFAPCDYIGLEIELNQSMLTSSRKRLIRPASIICEAIRRTCMTVSG